MTFSSSRKQRGSVLTPRGKPLFDDANRFGTKMLEKMGWSKGKGLGANLDGEQNFISVAHKSNQRGFGFADRNDQWTQHEVDFDVLLKSLNNNTNNQQNRDTAITSSNIPLTTNKEKQEISSLEQISRNSRSRVHYQKFIKGKDLSKYNAKELANIFGKKSLTDDDKSIANDIINNTTDNQNKIIPNFGITTIETGTSINDYFRTKRRKNINENEQPTTLENSHHSMESIEGDHSENVITKPSKKLIDFSVASDDDSSLKQSNKSLHLDAVDDGEILDDNGMEKRKKKEEKGRPTEIEEKSMRKMENVGNLEDEQNFNVVDKSKKKKKDKRKKEYEITNDTIHPKEEIYLNETKQIEEILLPKKKNNKGIHQNEVEKNLNESTCPTNDQTYPVVDSEPNIDQNNGTCKKKKKDKRTICNNEIIPSDDENVIQIKSKSKRKRTLVEDEGEDGGHSLIKNIITNLNNGIIITRDIEFSDDDEVDESKGGCNLKETFELDRYKAEVFRFFDMDAFRSSTIAKISGYGYSDKIQLKINTTGRDSEKINTLWDKALMNKYGKDVITTKKKQKYSIKALKKKNVFMTI